MNVVPPVATSSALIVPIAKLIEFGLGRLNKEKNRRMAEYATKLRLMEQMIEEQKATLLELDVTDPAALLEVYNDFGITVSLKEKRRDIFFLSFSPPAAFSFPPSHPLPNSRLPNNFSRARRSRGRSTVF